MVQLLSALAYLIPAVALFAVLALRRYPGERVLLAVIEKRRGRRSREQMCSAVTVCPRPRALLPRGGRLLACSLAVRPPPVPRLAPN
jgi:hypothetical protein